MNSSMGTATRTVSLPVRSPLADTERASSAANFEALAAGRGAEFHPLPSTPPNFSRAPRRPRRTRKRRIPRRVPAGSAARYRRRLPARRWRRPVRRDAREPGEIPPPRTMSSRLRKPGEAIRTSLSSDRQIPRRSRLRETGARSAPLPDDRERRQGRQKIRDAEPLDQGGVDEPDSGADDQANACANPRRQGGQAQLAVGADRARCSCSM